MPEHGSLLEQAKENQKAISADLDQLSKKYGSETFRIVGQRYFKNQREKDALRREIAAREAELVRLQKKAGR